MRQCPLHKKYLQKNLITHTYTLSRIDFHIVLCNVSVRRVQNASGGLGGGGGGGKRRGGGGKMAVYLSTIDSLYECILELGASCHFLICYLVK